MTLGKEVDCTADKFGPLAKYHDGLEIAGTALEEAQACFVPLREIVDVIETMGKPRRNDTRSKPAIPSSQLWDRGQAFGRKRRVPLIVSGSTDWTDIDIIFRTLYKVRDRIKQNRNQDIFFCHKGGKHGAEMIAVRWALARGINQARFDPRWSAHGRAAPFMCNDEMLDDKFAATGRGSIEDTRRGIT